MATVATETLNDHNSFYLSATSSPSRNSENMLFYSVPTSPARKSFESSYDVPESEPTTPREEYDDTNASFIEFEFETSRRFNVDENDDHDGVEKFEPASACMQQQQQHHQLKESLPAMAFADELFCDGKVMPLKPPPRFQYSNESTCNSPLSPLKSPGMKFSFSRRSLWNDDYDPFVAALENVREENREKFRRRSRSMSPLRAGSLRKLDKQQEIKESEQKQNPNQEVLNLTEANTNSSADYSVWVPNKNGQKGCQKTAEKIPIRLAEPKGVLFARSARLVKMGQEKPTKPNKEKLPYGKESEERGRRESKRKRVKKFLLRSASIGRTSNEEKAKAESEAVTNKQSFTRKLSFRSTGIAEYNQEKRVSEVAANMTLMQYRPKFFLCMGYGGKYVK